MNTVNTPGFTADKALSGNRGSYSTGMRVFANLHVTPQAISLGCFIRKASRTYSRCVGLGNDSQSCAALATDLAASVCDL